MNDLATWLRVQLDEDERVARAAGLSPPVLSWRAAENVVLDANDLRDIHGGFPPGERPQELAGTDWDEVAEHIARHDPARVLREVEAKRRILDEVESMLGGDPYQEGMHAQRLLPLLALHYADRPGYRDAWRPDYTA